MPFAIESLVFAIIYKISPAREGVLWKPVLVAGFFAGFLFEVLKVFMGIYVNVFGAASWCHQNLWRNRWGIRFPVLPLYDRRGYSFGSGTRRGSAKF